MKTKIAKMNKNSKKEFLFRIYSKYTNTPFYIPPFFSYTHYNWCYFACALYLFRILHINFSLYSCFFTFTSFSSLHHEIEERHGYCRCYCCCCFCCCFCVVIVSVLLFFFFHFGLPIGVGQSVCDPNETKLYTPRISTCIPTNRHSILIIT